MARPTKTAETVDAIEMLRRLIGFDTTSSKSNLALIEAVAEYLDGHGIAAHLVHDETGEKANLFATIGPDTDGGIVLSGHTDVVPVDGQDWATDPFETTIKDGLLYGRGACDMKGFIAVALSLVPEMVAADLQTPLHFALSYDEEVGCIGVPHLLAKIAKELPSPRIAIVGEPTDMALVNAHKGMATFKTTVTGLEAHSSAPQLGVSAITHAAEIVQFIDRLAREIAEHGPFHDAFTPPHTTFNIGRVNGGTAVNIIPRQCTVEWEFRLIPGDDIDEIRSRVDRFVEDDLLPRMRERFPGAAVETAQNASAPPLMPMPGSPAEALVRKLTGANQSGSVSFATEAGHFQTAGIDAVIIGPGSIEQAHKPNEFVALSQLDACQDFLKKVIAFAAETPPLP